MSFNTPVLFLVFNRPDTTSRVFEKIRQQKPVKLYIAADGARTGNKNDSINCAEVKKIVSNIDWPCEVKTLYREKNQGCKMAVSSAITWFFENEEMGIILEDDCLPVNSFFRYCEELLYYYKDDERIAGISGLNALAYEPDNGESYFFSKYVHIWGWASWRRVWKMYDLKMSAWPDAKKNHLLKIMSDGNRYFEPSLGIAMENAYQGKIDTWDYQFLFSYLTRSQMACIPAKNLIRNIGFSEHATHTKGEDSMLATLRTEDLSFPLKHPETVRRNVFADRLIDRKIFKMNIINYLRLLYTTWKKKLRK